MITWLMTVKEIKQHFRDYRTFIFMLGFPIVLMLVLGITLTNAFVTELELSDIKVAVHDASSGDLSQAFGGFEKQLASTGIAFVPLKDGENGRAAVEDNQYTAYVEVTDAGISQYGSSRDTVESGIVQGMLNAFADKYNAAAAVARTDPAKVGELLADADGGSYLKDESIAADRTPGSMDYYALSMTVMVGLWGAMSAGGLLRSEAVRGTGIRLVSAPIRRGEIYVGKVLGNVVSNSLCILAIIFFSKWVFKAYWGAHLPLVIGVLVCEIIMSTSLGIAANELFKNGGGRGVVMLIVQVGSFLGGAYFPVNESGVMGLVAWASPIRWGNAALTQIIYAGHTAAAWSAIGLYLGAALLLLGATAAVRRTREGF
ncbi:ABC transporter permease [Paenibacillus sp. MWE-103]|uniref:ABC transporter permease n=1 Tax=Paenibacillus artemisiicola TaxID=1172618 RepID=A0ABS3W972_9BACL|nr:ABC transporter permease [Paenibacillus artemisiicola]MBO7744822.1 ABC transporter permease [Paenibacillus artemisiicola]